MSEIKTKPLFNTMLSLTGDYWLGDPCYVFSDEDWQKLCSLMFEKGTADFDDSNSIRLVEVDGVACFLFGTAHGDGCYALKDGRKKIADLGVDAGMLSMIPMSLVNREDWREDCKWLGTVLTFDGKPEPIGVEGGNFYYGKYKINTDW